MTKENFEKKIKQYFIEENFDAKINFDTITKDTNLWDAGLIDSFRMISLILFLEDLLELDIEIGGNQLTIFHSIENMYKKFVE